MLIPFSLAAYLLQETPEHTDKQQGGVIVGLLDRYSASEVVQIKANRS